MVTSFTLGSGNLQEHNLEIPIMSPKLEPPSRVAPSSTVCRIPPHSGQSSQLFLDANERGSVSVQQLTSVSMQTVRLRVTLRRNRSAHGPVCSTLPLVALLVRATRSSASTLLYTRGINLAADKVRRIALLESLQASLAATRCWASRRSQ